MKFAIVVSGVVRYLADSEDAIKAAFKLFQVPTIGVVSDDVSIGDIVQPSGPFVLYSLAFKVVR